MEYIDFLIEVEEGQETRVLQLTDTQIIDASQRRYEDRLCQAEQDFWAKENMDARIFRYIRELVRISKPHLILMTGDLVYGEFDDSGSSLLTLVEHMEQYQIPWAPVYGNHDNESAMGAIWQNQQLIDAKHCLFKKGDTDGNGNYTVAIKQGEKIRRIFYMLDSNSCSAAHNPIENGVVKQHGFTEKQLRWLYARMEGIKQANGGGNIPSSVCWHVPTKEFVVACAKYTQNMENFTIHTDIQGDLQDFGALKEKGGIKSPFEVVEVDGKTFLSQLKKFGVDSTFVGHSHCVSTSIVYEGIRWTFGLKTGEYDRFLQDETGGTLITIQGDALQVKHLKIGD